MQTEASMLILYLCISLTKTGPREQKSVTCMNVKEHEIPLLAWICQWAPATLSLSPVYRLQMGLKNGS